MKNIFIIFLLFIIFSRFLLFVIYMIFLFIRYLLNKVSNLTFNPPKAHAFVEKPLNSAVNDIVLVAGLSPLIFNLILSSARLFAVGMYLSMFSDAIDELLIPFLISQMDYMIQNTLDMYTDALPYLNSYPNETLLRQIYEYLTPYLRSSHTIFQFINQVVDYLADVDSPYFTRVEGLEEEFRAANTRLLFLYRDIERLLGIAIEDSPISLV